jgi:hypothetical protein
VLLAWIRCSETLWLRPEAALRSHLSDPRSAAFIRGSSSVVGSSFSYLCVLASRREIGLGYLHPPASGQNLRKSA